MLRVSCDICRRDIPYPTATGDTYHFCERCSEWSEEYKGHVNKIARECFAIAAKKVEKFRNDFLQSKLHGSMKVV